MKIFETVRLHLESIGFCENERPFNQRQIDLVFKTIAGMSLVAVHLFHVANTPKDYMDGVFVLTVMAILIFISILSSNIVY